MFGWEEAGHHLGLGDEHVHELLVVREVGQDALDRHHLLEPFHPRPLGAEQLGHAPTAIFSRRK